MLKVKDARGHMIRFQYGVDSESANNEEGPAKKRGKRTQQQEISETDEEAGIQEADVVDEINDLLAEQRPGTDSETNDDMNDSDMSFLDDLAQDFEQDEQVGSDVNPKLATIVTSSLTKKLAEEKIKTMMEKYSRPKNCESLVTVKVNSEIWAKMKRETRSKDLMLQKTQAKLNKAIMAITSVADAWLAEKGEKGRGNSAKCKPGSEPKPGNCVKTLLDAVALVGAASQKSYI